MTIQDREGLKNKIERSVSPNIAKPPRPSLTRKQLLSLKDRLGKPKEKMDFRQTVAATSASTHDLFSKALRDPAPLNSDSPEKYSRNK